MLTDHATTEAVTIESALEESEHFLGFRWPWFPIPGVPRGPWVVLVAGHDYERSGVDFEKIALSRMRLLTRRNVAAQRQAKTPLATVIDTAPRFVLFDVRSGVVRTSVAMQPKGDRVLTEVRRFQPVSTANYSGGGHVFDTQQTDRMSITDVYDHIRSIGRSEAGTLTELSFLAHGWAGGPILVNSFDQSSSAARDPNDKDPRTAKDFSPPNMTAAALAEFRAAFSTAGRSWVWGCSFTNSPRQVLHRVLTSTKYRSTKAGGLVDADVIPMTFTKEHAELFFHVDPTFFPARAADGEFPLAFSRTFAQVKAFIRGRMALTYCPALATAAGVPCFGAPQGTYSDYERGVTDPVMLVPTAKPPYADDFTRSIRFYTTYLGVTLDPEGRNYARFDP